MVLFSPNVNRVQAGDQLGSGFVCPADIPGDSVMQSMFKVASFILFLIFFTPIAEAQTGPWSVQGPSNCADQYGNFDAFIPGMRGSGACNRGGFVPGTDVIVVTNRNNSGPGSLREALQASCPKVILFGVAGVITNDSKLQARDCDNWSIVGSSAPGNITIWGSNTDIQLNTRGNNITIGHLVLPSRSNDAISFGRDSFPYDNITVYNSSFMWGDDSATWECYPQNGQEITKLMSWQNTFQAGFAEGLMILNNTCQDVSVIRSVFMDSKERSPLVRGDGYFAANNVHINMQQWFTRPQPCDGTTYPPFLPVTRMSWINNYYAEGPQAASWRQDSYTQFIGLFGGDSGSCTDFQVWDEGTTAMNDYPNQNIADCSNHACMSGLSSYTQGSAITSIHPTGYVPESITNTLQGHIDFVTKIGQHAGARPLDQFAYISDRIAQSINAIDGSGPVSSWVIAEEGGSIANEGGIAVITDTPQSGYDPTDATQNPCGVAMPTGSAADEMRTSGLTRLHEWAIGCFMDSVMPAGYREDKLQDYPAPEGGGSGPRPPRPNPPEWNG
jgi:hypothetical protein